MLSSGAWPGQEPEEKLSTCGFMKGSHQMLFLAALGDEVAQTAVAAGYILI